MQRDRARQQRVLREQRVHRAQVGVEVEHAAHAAHEVGNALRVARREVDEFQPQLVLAGDRAHPQPRAAVADRAQVGVAVDALDAGDRALREEAQQQPEIQRRPVAEPQRERARGRLRRGRLPADRGRRHAATGEERGVEAAQAVVAGGERDLGRRQ
jgi:hypothetical protein